jgi:CRP-like cAMP-binding protein
MESAHEILSRKLKVHSDLDADDEAAFRKLTAHNRSLQPGEDFICQGDKPTMSALVTAGMVGRYHLLSGGKRQYLSFHMTGDLPDAQTLFIERMDHAVCALGDGATLVLIPHSEIFDLFERRPAAGFAIWRETLLDAAIFREAITNNSARPVQTRMAHLFCEIYYRARVAGLARQGSFRLPIHQAQIGDALGMSIVTVNRTMQLLRGTGAVDLRSNELVVHDWKRLVELGDFDSNYLHLKRPSRM